MNSIYYFSLALEFCSPVWLISFVIVDVLGDLLGEGLLHWFSGVFAPGRITPPLLGCHTKKGLLIALLGFCSPKAFHRALEDESENRGLPISSPRAKNLGPHPQCTLREKQSITPASLLSIHTLAHPAWDQAFLSQAPNPTFCPQTLPTPAVCTQDAPLRGWRVFCPRFCHLLGPWSKSGFLIGLQFLVYGNTEVKPTPGLVDCSKWLPHSDTWELCCNQTPWSSWIILRPHCPTWKSAPALPPKQLSGREVPHWSRVLKFPILHSTARSLSSSQPRRLPSSLFYLQRYITSESLLCTSYLVESSCFSICRIAAVLFIDLQLSSQVFRMIW